MKIFWTVLEWALSRLFGGGDASDRDDKVNLGKAQNELEHVKQDNEDRAALDNLKSHSSDDADERMRRGDF